MSPNHWLMKAEPDSRVVKGKDVKFSVEDFERVGTTPWEGVRNAEARNLMQAMKVGDQVFFYHSNCKTPGIAALAQVSKEAYPDYTAWDTSHPYFDPKSDKNNPKWYMVDVTFASRVAHFVPLSLLRSIATAEEPPEEVSYLNEHEIAAIKVMPLVSRGRLSVQRVQKDAWDAVCKLASRGGWEQAGQASTGGKTKAKLSGASKGKSRVSKKRKRAEDEDKEEGIDDATEDDALVSEGASATKKPAARKLKASEKPPVVSEKLGVRRSMRTRPPS